MISKLKNEPVLSWATGSISVNVAQLLAIPHLPAWLHVVILVVTSFSATIKARQQVTPASKAEAAVAKAKRNGNSPVYG